MQYFSNKNGKMGRHTDNPSRQIALMDELLFLISMQKQQLQLLRRFRCLPYKYDRKNRKKVKQQ